MSYYRIILTFISGFFFVGCLHLRTEEIHTIKSIEEVDFSDIQQNTLVIFDVDETLIQPSDIYVLNENTSVAKVFREKMIFANPQVKNWDALMSIIILSAKRPLIESTVLSKIELLRKHHVPVIAFTGMNSGSLGSIKKLEEWRYNQLKTLGFEGDFKDKTIHFTEFNRHPVFYRGVLVSDLEEKGPVLGEFLDKMHLSPLKIIMFDDDAELLGSVQAECQKRHIAFQGYLYQGAKSKSWDEKLVQFQAEYLIKNRIWLNDTEVKEKIINID